jgi:hypothetical protein
MALFERPTVELFHETAGYVHAERWNSATARHTRFAGEIGSHIKNTLEPRASRSGVAAWHLATTTVLTATTMLEGTTFVALHDILVLEDIVAIDDVLTGDGQRYRRVPTLPLVNRRADCCHECGATDRYRRQIIERREDRATFRIRTGDLRVTNALLYQLS